jgi:hypothetical protein
MLVARRLRWSRAETDAVDHPSTATRVIARAAFHGGDRAIGQGQPEDERYVFSSNYLGWI